MNKLLPWLLLIAGCASLPDYERPLPPVPAQWPVKVGAGETAATGDWRAFFNDPPLQALIEAALAHNRDMKIAIARVAEARALAGIASTERWPALDVTVQEQLVRVPGDLNNNGRPALNRRFDANLGITAFELDFWGRVRSLEAAAQANFLASDYARRAFRLSLISDVASAWYSLVELTHRVRFAERTVSSRFETRRLVERRRQAGLASDLDFLAADGAWQAARAELMTLERQKAAAENALRLLVGDEYAVPPAPSFGRLPEIAVGLPSEVLLNRPDVMAAEQKLIATHANLAAARAAFFPRIVLTALGGTASRALSGLFGSGSGAWSFAPVLKWPLFDADRIEAAVDLAAARKNIAVAEYEKTIQQAFREVADLLFARQSHVGQLQALEAAEAAQAERLQRIEARHAAGVSSHLELLDAQREHFAAQQGVVSARRALAAATAALFKATGGIGE